MSKPQRTHRLVSVVLDEASIGRANRDIEHERGIAIYDLLEDNDFEPEGDRGGPYALKIALVEQRLVLEITREDSAPVATHLL
ncbi:MAG TPA: UPF0262 family protein, partial [Xanthobacteraceae bacterium]|nr:UPF0262 family protein [Xanthobacteraceae bacterium]